MIHVRHGKGAKDRYVPLPQRTLQLLRQYWQQHRNRKKNQPHRLAFFFLKLHISSAAFRSERLPTIPSQPRLGG
jgi:integrase